MKEAPGRMRELVIGIVMLLSAAATCLIFVATGTPATTSRLIPITVVYVLGMVIAVAGALRSD